MKKHLKSLKAGLLSRSAARTNNLNCKRIVYDSNRFGTDYRPVWDMLQVMVENHQFNQVCNEIEKYRKLNARDEYGERIHLALSGVLVPDFEDVTVEQALRQVVAHSNWYKENPDSPFAASSLIETLKGLAWLYRGNGYAHSVGLEAKKQFQKCTDKATQIFQETRHHSDHWFWVRTYFRYGLVECENAAQVLSRFEFAFQSLGLNRDLYDFTAYALLPRWYGDYEILERFADKSARQTKTVVGEGVYGLCYLSALDMQENPVDLHFDRGRFLQGLMDWLAKYPSQYHRTKMISICFNAQMFDEALVLIEGLTELHFEVFETGHDLFAVNSLCQEFSSA